MSGRILGTAGHIDHGKTSLVRALTGIDTDRLPEEKKRGITIELGFASMTLDGLQVGVVDVPGHERFVRTMVAGAAGLDALLLVVAADDGVMPQTKEHIAIAELLGVTRGVCAITKSDLVDDEMMELVTEDVRAALSHTALSDIMLVPVSSTTGMGIDALRAALIDVLTPEPRRAKDAAPYLAVDRSMTRPGFGTVVAGSLQSGTLRVDDTLMIHGADVDDEGRTAVIRGLHVHGVAVTESGPSSRVAVNLRNVEVSDVPRGATLTAPQSLLSTRRLLVRLALLDGAPAIASKGVVACHIGTAEVHGRIAFLNDERSLALFRSTTPLKTFATQRFVLRLPGHHAMTTIGGGEVLDPNPDAGRGALTRLRRRAPALAAASTDSARLGALVEMASPQPLSEVSARTRLPLDADLAAVANAFAQEKRGLRIVIGGAPAYIGLDASAGIRSAIVDAVAAAHRARPLKRGLIEVELPGILPHASKELLAAIASALVESGELIRADGTLALPTFKRPKDADALFGRAEQALRALGSKGITDDELAALLGVQKKVAADLIGEFRQSGIVARIAEFYFYTSALVELKSRIRLHFSKNPTLSPTDFKELGGGLSRKFAIPLLEWLDKEGFTKRQGDARIAGPSSTSSA